MRRQESFKEERWNTLSHGFGVVLGVLGFVLMYLKINWEQPWALFSVSVYGLSIIILFLASTLYHWSKDEVRKHRFRIIDHISIYLLIAGTYTPVLLLALAETKGWLLFWVVWAIAAFGLILKIFFTGKFEIFSTLLYLVMGWLIVFDFSNLSNFLGSDGVLWLFAGGLFYTVGIVFYALQRLPYNHVIWHFFVLAGAICHFVMIYGFVI
jgi:hemolysin III